MSRSRGLKFVLYLCALCELVSGVHAQTSSAGSGSVGDGVPPRIFMNTLELSSRYVYADLHRGDVTDREMEYRMTTVVRARIDAQGRTYLKVRAQSGSAFQNSWDEEGIGLTGGHLSYNVKSFSLLTQANGHLSVEVGGIEFERGAGSEITYAANEGWLSGYRLVVDRKYGIVKKAVATFGYVGDFSRPNFFSRASRMGDLNYSQIMLTIPVGTEAEGSAEIDSIEGRQYFRDALYAKSLHTKLLSSERLEAITRLSGGATIGWGVTANRTVSHWLDADLRYSSMPVGLFERKGNQVLINGGEVGLGKRGALVTTWHFGNGVDLEILTSRRLDSMRDTPRWRSFVSVHYDLSKRFNYLFNK